MNKTKRLWLLLGGVLFVTFFVLGWFGKEVYRQVPPLPESIQSTTGQTLFTKEDILNGH